MPYFQFRSPANAAVEVGGNTEAEVTAALERSAAVANKALARAWVHAFFARRAHAIAKQKAEQAGDEDAADQAYDLLVEAEEVEAAAKAAYVASVAAPAEGATGGGTAPAASADARGGGGGNGGGAGGAAQRNPYADVKAEAEDDSREGGAAAAVDDDDGFM